jgi:hypothetical protein
MCTLILISGSTFEGTKIETSLLLIMFTIESHDNLKRIYLHQGIQLQEAASFLFFLPGLEIKPKALHMVDKASTTVLQTQT